MENEVEKCCGNCRLWDKIGDADDKLGGVCQYRPTPYASLIFVTSKDDGSDCPCFERKETPNANHN